MREYNLMKEINDVNERRFRIKRTLNMSTGSVLNPTLASLAGRS